MKNVGIVRNLDLLGRIVLPVELRKTLEFEEGQALEVCVEGDSIILKKYKPGCHCCNETEVKATVLGVNLCEKCLSEFAKAKDLIDKIRG